MNAGASWEIRDYGSTNNEQRRQVGRELVPKLLRRAADEYEQALTAGTLG